MTWSGQAVVPITTTVSGFCRMSGLGKTKVWEMIADGTLDTIKIGTRRLIVIESYQRLVSAMVRRDASEAAC